ncbi:sphingomyelin phosphodiesterase-like [Diadema antillarum]|uniref:sphingomyelin phosphodiesterase-like n=1 Tax=Diadema antillarum TaxID=105358 RepID=UPI003A875243
MATFSTKRLAALAALFFCVVIATCKPVTSADVKTKGEYVLDEQTRSTLAYKLAPFLVSYSRAAATRTPAPYVKMMNDIIRDPSLGIGADIECDACKELMKAVDDLIQTDESRDLIVEIAAEVCKTLQIEDDRVCDLVVREFKDEVIDVATLHYLSPDQVCGTLLGPSCAIPYDYNSDWNVTFPNIPKPHMTPVQPPQPGSPTLRVLHISDLHIDLMYEPGSNAECGEPLCCRSNDGPPAPGTKGAGKWGDFRTCDVSLDLMKNTLENIAKTQKVDFIYMTGDLPAHNVWNQTRSDQLKILDMVTDLLMKYFPGVKVYPTLGNHESAPVNSFPPEFITGDQSEKWLYEACVSSWIEKSGWLPKSAKETMLRGGYYDVLVYPGFRVVSLNANAGNTQNWWLRINATDPDAQLQWLVSVLQAAETAKEKVHILGHIPPSQNLAVWSKNYELIVKRYASTITGQFFGHTHKDQFKIYYDNVTNRQPINVVYVAGAITPDTQNPGYRVYTIDGNYTKSSWAVLDHDNYYLNLTEANLTDKPTWRLEYTAKKAFNMTSLQPSEWGRVVEEMKKNETVFDQYYAYFHRLWEGRSPCDASCRQNMICDIETARSGDSSFC